MDKTFGKCCHRPPLQPASIVVGDFLESAGHLEFLFCFVLGGGRRVFGSHMDLNGERKKLLMNSFNRSTSGITWPPAPPSRSDVPDLYRPPPPPPRADLWTPLDTFSSGLSVTSECSCTVLPSVARLCRPPSMMGTQRCRLKLNTEDLSKASYGGGGGGGFGTRLVYALPRSVLQLCFKWLVFICMIFRAISRCVYIYFTFLSAEGRERPLWMFGGNAEASELFAVWEFDFSEADNSNCQRRRRFGSSAANKSTATFRVMSIILPDLV